MKHLPCVLKSKAEASVMRMPGWTCTIHRIRIDPLPAAISSVVLFFQVAGVRRLRELIGSGQVQNQWVSVTLPAFCRKDLESGFDVPHRKTSLKVRSVLFSPF